MLATINYERKIAKKIELENCACGNSRLEIEDSFDCFRIKCHSCGRTREWHSPLNNLALIAEEWNGEQKLVGDRLKSTIKPLNLDYDNLVPCGRCGGKELAIISRERRNDDKKAGAVGGTVTKWHAECIFCGTLNNGKEHDSKLEAIISWNLEQTEFKNALAEIKKESCLFCGSKTLFVEDHYNEDEETNSHYNVRCRDCGSIGPDAKSPSEAVGKYLRGLIRK